MKILKWLFGWLLVSNRWKHLLGGFLVGLVCGFLAAVACGGGMEYKDSAWGGRWDWMDLLSTALGGLVGGAARMFVVYHIGVRDFGLVVIAV